MAVCRLSPKDGKGSVADATLLCTCVSEWSGKLECHLVCQQQRGPPADFLAQLTQTPA